MERGIEGIREIWISGIQEVGIVKRNAGKWRDAGIRNPCLLQKDNKYGNSKYELSFRHGADNARRDERDGLQDKECVR